MKHPRSNNKYENKSDKKYDYKSDTKFDPISTNKNTDKDIVSEDATSESVPILLALLVPASLRKVIAAMPTRLRQSLISFFGVCSMIAPLALWIAPSMTVWLSILGGSLVSILLCWGLVWFGPEDHY